MSYAIQKFKSYGSRTLAVGGSTVINDWGLPRNAQVTAIGVQVTSTLKNVDAANDYTVQQKEALSKIALTLACGAPVSNVIFQADARAAVLAQGLASGAPDWSPDGLAVAKAGGTRAWNPLLVIPFFAGNSKRSKDFSIPGVALESLTIGLTGQPYAADADVTFDAFAVETFVFYHEAESIVWGPVLKWRQISVSEDSRSYSGKLLALASLPPLGKAPSDYPDVVVSVDGHPVYTDTSAGLFPQIAFAMACNQANPFVAIDGTGETIGKVAWLLDGGSILDAAHRTVELAYATSLTTALGTSDSVVVCDLVTYAKPDGTVSVSVPGKAMRGAVENLPVQAD
jgi:hypothetical protein